MHHVLLAKLLARLAVTHALGDRFSSDSDCDILAKALRQVLLATARPHHADHVKVGLGLLSLARV